MRAIRKIGRFFSKFLYASTFIWPWFIRRLLLQWFYGYEIHPSAKIGLSWIRPKRLKMAPRSYIGHLNMCKGLDDLIIGEETMIGRLNWITGFPSDDSFHFSADLGRHPALIVGDHVGITNRHIIDCTNRVTIGRMSTIAGFYSQIMTHSIDLVDSIQRSKEIVIGEYTFVGTRVIILGGAVLPDRCVLGAGSLLAKELTEPDMLYAGMPAKAVKKIEPDAVYFHRERGFVQ